MGKKFTFFTGYLPKITVFAAAAMAAAVTSARAVTLYSTSFEPPSYVAGATVVGVDGWTAGSGTGASQTVSTAHAANGTQGLAYDNTGTNTSFYSVVHPLGAFQSNTVTVTTSMYVPSTNGVDRNAEFTLSTGTLGSTVLGLALDGAGNIRFGNTWSALFSTTTFFATAPAGSFADRWLTGTLIYNPATGTGTTTLSGFGGATTSYTSSFTVGTAPTNTNLGTDYLNTTSRLGSVYYDSLAVNAVPEPSTAAALLVGAGMLGVIIKRRRVQA